MLFNVCLSVIIVFFEVTDIDVCLSATIVLLLYLSQINAVAIAFLTK